MIKLKPNIEIPDFTNYRTPYEGDKEFDYLSTLQRPFTEEEISEFQVLYLLDMKNPSFELFYNIAKEKSINYRRLFHAKGRPYGLPEKYISNADLNNKPSEYLNDTILKLNENAESAITQIWMYKHKMCAIDNADFINTLRGVYHHILDDTKTSEDRAQLLSMYVIFHIEAYTVETIKSEIERRKDEDVNKKSIELNPYLTREQGKKEDVKNQVVEEIKQWINSSFANDLTPEDILNVEKAVFEFLTQKTLYNYEVNNINKLESQDLRNFFWVTWRLWKQHTSINKEERYKLDDFIPLLRGLFGKHCVDIWDKSSYHSDEYISKHWKNDNAKIIKIPEQYKTNK